MPLAGTQVEDWQLHDSICALICCRVGPKNLKIINLVQHEIFRHTLVACNASSYRLAFILCAVQRSGDVKLASICKVVCSTIYNRYNDSAAHSIVAP